MSNLLEKYEEMRKEAALNEITAGRVEILEKYATVAEELLEQTAGDDYTEEDVIKVAKYLINADLVEEEEQEKIAEYDQLGRIMARGYLDELENANE